VKTLAQDVELKPVLDHADAKRSKRRLSVELRNKGREAQEPAAHRAEDVHLAPTATCADAFRVIGRNCLTQLTANEPAMLRGDGEALHQMRIALRRLRAAISTFSDIVADGECERIKVELRWITGELGTARDLDVFVAEVVAPLREHAPDQPGMPGLCRSIEARRTKAHNSAADAVRSRRFRTLVLDTTQWVDAGAWRKSNDDLQQQRRDQPIAALAADELARRRKKIRKRGRSLRQLAVPERHKLRIGGKKLRYAMQFFADVFPDKKSAKRREAALSALKELQDALGGLNDIAAREKLVSEIALAKSRKLDGPVTPERAFAGGVIFGSQEAHQEQMLAAADSAYVGFRKVKPFWK
jgi:triphosphatase